MDTTTERTNSTTTNINTNTAQNTYANAINKWGCKLFLILCLLFLVFVAYLLAANIVLDVGSMHVHKKNIQTISAKLTRIDNTTVLFEANCSMLVSFRVTGDIEPFPEIAYFNLSTTNIRLYPVSTFANSTYKISQKEELPVELKFSQHQTYLPEELLWLLEKRRFLVIDHIPSHTKFTCNIPYKAFRYCYMADEQNQECQILGNGSWCK